MLAEYGTMRRDGIIVQYYLTRMRACMHAALAVPDRSLAGGNRLLTRMHACMETETDFYVALFLAVYVESLTNYYIVA